MYSLLEDLIVNLSLVISLLFIFMKIRWSRNQRKQSFKLTGMLDGLMGGIIGIVLMHFSVALSQDTIVDFRFIPVILMFLFSGKEAAGVATLVIGLARFFFGVSASAWSTLLVSIVLLLGLILIDRLWKEKDGLRLKGTCMIILATVLYASAYIVNVEEITWTSPILIGFCILSVTGGLFSIFLMNYLRLSEYLLRKYEIESSIDFLTGLKNVRTYNEIIDRYSQKVKEQGSSLSMAMIDIDHFKSLNDAYGHAAGDFVLVELSNIFEDMLGEDAYVFRKGGEEFAALFPSASLGKVITLMEGCRKRVAVTPFEVSVTATVFTSISVGISQYPSTVDSIEDLASAADDKLYRAKEKGRNVVIY